MGGRHASCDRMDRGAGLAVMRAQDGAQTAELSRALMSAAPMLADLPVRLVQPANWTTMQPRAIDRKTRRALLAALDRRDEPRRTPVMFW